jgi:hypothetical protein
MMAAESYHCEEIVVFKRLLFGEVVVAVVTLLLW